MTNFDIGHNLVWGLKSIKSAPRQRRMHASVLFENPGHFRGAGDMHCSPPSQYTNRTEHVECL
jgi:hypothetical protein